MREAVQAVAVLDDGFSLHVVQHQANHLGRVLAMVEERYKLGDRPLEIDVVFPECVIGIDEQSLGAILSPHVFMITAWADPRPSSIPPGPNTSPPPSTLPICSLPPSTTPSLPTSH